MLVQGVFYLISPVDGNAPFETNLAAVTANPGRFELMQWIQTPFFLLIPAVIAVAWVSHRAAPRLSTVGGLIALIGLSAGFFLMPGVVTLEYLTVREGLDRGAMAKLAAVMADQPSLLIGGLLFILAITFGLLLLGIALWRSRVAPAWMGIALAVGGFTHPFMPGHVAAGIGLLVTAVGFAGASVALVRMRNDDFDLPPVAPVRRK
jgi:hypothetical protein